MPPKQLGPVLRLRTCHFPEQRRAPLTHERHSGSLPGTSDVHLKSSGAFARMRICDAYLGAGYRNHHALVDGRAGPTEFQLFQTKANCSANAAQPQLACVSGTIVEMRSVGRIGVCPLRAWRRIGIAGPSVRSDETLMRP